MDRRIVCLVNEDGSEVALNVESNNDPCAVEKAIRFACKIKGKGGWKFKLVFKEGNYCCLRKMDVIKV